ncbi:hypothetical protein Ancab_018492 [Ancistrocladus abbreviatus]
MSPKRDVNLAKRALKNGASLFMEKPINDHDINTLWQHVILAKRAIALEKEEKSASQERSNQENRSRRMNINKADAGMNYVDNNLEEDCKHLIRDNKGKEKVAGSADDTKHLRVDPIGKKKQVVIDTEMAEWDQPRKQVLDGIDHMDMADSDKQANTERKGAHGDEERQERSEKRSKRSVAKCHSSIKKSTEGYGKNRRSYASGNKHYSDWNPECNNRFMQAIHKMGSEEVSAQKVYEAMNDPNVTLHQVANNLQKFEDKVQQLSGATKNGSGGSYITGGADPNIQEGRDWVPCLGGHGADTRNVRPFPLIPVASLGLQVTGKAGNSLGIQRATCPLDGAEKTLPHTPQFTRTNNCYKLQMARGASLNVSSFRIPTGASHKESIPLLTNVIPELQLNALADFNLGTQTHAEQSNRDVKYSAHEIRANATDMESSPGVPEVSLGLHINSTCPLSLADRIKQVREVYRADESGNSLLSNREYSGYQQAYNREFHNYVSETGGGVTNAGFLSSISEPSLEPLVGGADNLCQGIQNSGTETVSNGPLNYSLQFLASAHSPEFNSLLGDETKTWVTGLEGANSQMADYNMLNIMMTPGFTYSSYSVSVDQTSSPVNGSQSSNIPEIHPSSIAGLPCRQFTTAPAPNDNIPATDVISTGLAIEIDSLPPLNSTHPSHSINLDQASKDYADTEVFSHQEELHGFRNQPILSDTNNQPHACQMCPEADNSYLQKLDEFNLDGLFPELQHGIILQNENLGLSSEDMAAIFNDS